MALPSGISELAWIALFCFGFIFVTCFRLYWKRILVSLGKYKEIVVFIGDSSESPKRFTTATQKGYHA